MLLDVHAPRRTTDKAQAARFGRCCADLPLMAKPREWPADLTPPLHCPHGLLFVVCLIGLAPPAAIHHVQLDVLNQWINILQSVQLPFAVIPVSPGLLSSHASVASRLAAAKSVDHKQHQEPCG